MITYTLLTEAVAAARRTRKPIPAPSVPYPWTKHHTGWWHVSGKYMLFPWNELNNFHITQVVKKPSFFGFTKASLFKVIQSGFDYNDISDDKQANREAEYFWNLMLEGEMDHHDQIEQALFGRGWVRTRCKMMNGRMELQLLGHTDALRKAVGIAMLHIPPTENPAESSKVVMLVEDRKIGRWQHLLNMESMELYYKGRLVPSNLIPT